MFTKIVQVVIFKMVSKKKILTVVGARPQFIKSIPVSDEILKSKKLEEVVVNTGQHFDFAMSEIFFQELGATPPQRNLGVHGGSHAEMTGKMLVALESTMLIEKPSLVLVYGDTNSTLAGALCAAKLGIPIGHVEAGVRSWNRDMPEEINRVVTDQLSDILFAPTDSAVENLKKEGKTLEQIHSVGDVMFDAALRVAPDRQRVENVTAKLGLEPRNYVVVTIHRAENTIDDDRLSRIVESVLALSREVPVIWPVHPRIKITIDKLMSSLVGAYPNLTITGPVGYVDFASLISGARCVATDSGGLQKEAFFHGVSCITLRKETEWPELVDAGWNLLVNVDEELNLHEKILRAEELVKLECDHFGRGNASRNIVEVLGNSL